MVIQCEQCRTKFRLDDEKVSERGVKVRCAKCRHVFTVRKEQEPATMSAEPAVAVASAAAFAESVAAPPADSFDMGQTDAAAAGEFDFGDVSFSTEAKAATVQDVAFSDKTVVMPPRAAAEPTVDLGFDFGEARSSSTPAAEPVVEFDFGEPPKGPTVVDDPGLADFDFGDVAPSAAASQTAAFDLGDLGSLADAAPAAATRSDSQGFSFDDAVPQTADPAASFDLSGVDFTRSEQPASATTPTVAAFSLEDLDLSADATQIAMDSTATASSGTLFEPVDDVVASRQVAAASDITFDLPTGQEEAPPPLSISSRKRQGSTISILVAVITVVVVAVLGFVAYTFISDGPKALSLLGGAPATAEDGKITVQNVKAYFVSTSASGELLVITGEALNTYKKPRAALQVKGVVFGATNQPVATRTVYAGNMLTREQLMEMPSDKIEAAMNNQFGDSLVNMEVQPGKTIPFTIVIINPPTEGKEFAVESVGSTVAASTK